MRFVVVPRCVHRFIAPPHMLVWQVGMMKRAIMDKSEEQEENECTVVQVLCLACLEFILEQLRALLEYFNRWAFT